MKNLNSKNVKPGLKVGPRWDQRILGVGAAVLGLALLGGGSLCAQTAGRVPGDGRALIVERVISPSNQVGYLFRAQNPSTTIGLYSGEEPIIVNRELQQIRLVRKDTPRGNPVFIYVLDDGRTPLP